MVQKTKIEKIQLIYDKEVAEQLVKDLEKLEPKTELIEELIEDLSWNTLN